MNPLIIVKFLRGWSEFTTNLILTLVVGDLTRLFQGQSTFLHKFTKIGLLLL
jgi:hypothetical protein